jgi:hypothetical protein
MSKDGFDWVLIFVDVTSMYYRTYGGERQRERERERVIQKWLVEDEMYVVCLKGSVNGTRKQISRYKNN